ncbi:MAG TPA: hypothetical protein VNA69_18830 [Thermoanaerobaculia bacterium]|nr:hypothetical protein [Thermoanaerobaculia bacterium]
MADRNFLCYPLWEQAVATGAKLVWRAKLQLVIPKIRKLRDGSYLAKLYPSPKDRRQDRDGILVRLIDYRIDEFRESYRLITNIRGVAFKGHDHQFN